MGVARRSPRSLGLEPAALVGSFALLTRNEPRHWSWVPFGRRRRASKDPQLAARGLPYSVVDPLGLGATEDPLRPAAARELDVRQHLARVDVDGRHRVRVPQAHEQHLFVRSNCDPVRKFADADLRDLLQVFRADDSDEIVDVIGDPTRCRSSPTEGRACRSRSTASARPAAAARARPGGARSGCRDRRRRIR